MVQTQDLLIWDLSNILEGLTDFLGGGTIQSSIVSLRLAYVSSFNNHQGQSWIPSRGVELSVNTIRQLFEQQVSHLAFDDLTVKYGFIFF